MFVEPRVPHFANRVALRVVPLAEHNPYTLIENGPHSSFIKRKK
jgi:hypothetical protein